MARVPQTVPDEAEIKRSIPMAGWVYNAMIAAARKEKRDVNAHIALIIERAAAELVKPEKDKGNRAPMQKAA